MPRPNVRFVIAYGAGLATGLAHFGDPLGVAVILLVLGAAAWKRGLALVPIAVLVGRLSASAAWLAEADRCVSLLPGQRIEISVRLLEPADIAGGLVSVRPMIPCRGTVSASWPAGSPMSAGSTAQVFARWITRPGVVGRSDGLLVVTGVSLLVEDPTAAERLRSWISATTRRLYGDRAALVDALILNRRSAMDPQLRDRYVQSGLIHILSISGFHVGLIVAWVFMLCRVLRASRERAIVIAACTGCLYVAFLGWPAPATRAAALAALLAICQLRQRKVDPDALLAMTCLVVLISDPWAVLDLGAWLSAGSLWGATHFSHWGERALGGGRWASTLTSSVGATLTTAPVTSAILGNVALVGIALNFIAIPLAAVAVPGVIASVLVAPVWPGLASALASGSGAGLMGLDLLASLGASVPGGHVVQAAEPLSAAPWVALLAAALWGMSGGATGREAFRRWSLAAAVASLVSLLFALAPGARDKGSDLTLHFLDVGQGDAAAIRTPGGHWVVVDAGPRGPRDDAGRRVVAPFLAREGVQSLSALVISHAHADHIGGAASVLERVPASLVIEPGELISDSIYLGFLDELASLGIPWQAGRPGRQFELDGVRFTLLHPDTTWSEWRDDLNEDSVVLLVEYGQFQALFTGDAGFHAESLMIRRARSVDFLKVGHHGSRYATGDAWLDRLQPKAAVVSVGRRNTYGHPSAETLGRLAHHGVSVWRTDEEGDVTLRTDGRTMTVEGRRGREVFDVTDSP